MDKKHQRVSIAQYLGAKIITMEFPEMGSGTGKKWAWGGDAEKPCAYPGGGFYGFGWNEEARISELPDYLNDLNAMQQAVSKLTEEQGLQFVQELYKVLERAYEGFEYASGEPTVTTWYLMTAKAALWAEAYLRALNLWIYG